MADENIITPAVQPVPAPAEAVQTPPVIAEVAQPAAEATPAVEVTAPVQPTTVLGAEPPKVEAKTDAKVDAPVADKPAETPADPAKAEDAKIDAKVEAEKAPDQKKDEAAQSAEPAPLPTYEPFKFAEGITPDEKGLSTLTTLLGELELAKGDHTKTQDVGQKLVDYYVAEQQTNLKRQQEYFVGLFDKQKTSWKEAFLKDPEIGGERWETSAAAAKEFISTHGGTEAQQKELRQLMEATGVGNHPAMIRIFAKAMKNMGEGIPLPAGKPETSMPKSKIEKRYGKTS